MKQADLKKVIVLLTYAIMLLIHTSIHAICDNTDRITGSAKSGTTVFV